MDKERVNIKMQRHLRPLTTASKAAVSRGGTRPSTAGAAVLGGSSRTRASRVSKQNLRESHLQAFGKVREFVGPDVPEADAPVTAVCQHGLPPMLELSGPTKVPETSQEAEDCPAADDQQCPNPPKHPTLETWLTGLQHSSDEFDTDVEEDLESTPMTSISVDATGKLEYEEQCKKRGFVPVSYLCRHLGERNVRMRHRYLGGTATKPLALAFKHNTVTENLDLSDNYIEGSGTTYIANMLKENHFIVSLNLSNNFIGRLGAEAIAEMLESNTTLKVLSLSGETETSLQIKQSANKAMLFYFSDNKRARGRPQTTLPITLNNDLKKLVATKLELTTQTDLDTLRLIAEDRPKWNALVAEIRKTAETARSDDPASGRL
ncbi:leucine-rich repeat-containing protein 74a-like [Plakobranchus ocellatus]|uniref:Leucine-rich repeat-containing protein 74a-like n=1 Tax=Plakobranchus ocellatus TaxID=259542 RepID=A0AAV4CLR6_9GAST|nr:leucine-rich repeat-containing protein 74a-like [Plakobranchus ocellatus]